MLLASLTRFRSYLEILRQARPSGRRQHAGPAALAWHRIRQRLVPLWRGQGLGAQGPDHASCPLGSPAGIVGLNGAGKTTIVKLLCRFYEPQRGAIRWDGLDLREFTVSSLRQRLSVTFQDFAHLRADREGEHRNRPGVPHRGSARDRGSSAAGRDRRHADNTAARLHHPCLRGYSSTRRLDTRSHLVRRPELRVALARTLMRSDASVMILERTQLRPGRGSRVQDPPDPAQRPRRQDKPPDLTSPERHTRRGPHLRAWGRPAGRVRTAR